MKKYGLLLSLSFMFSLCISCRDRELNHPKQGEELREVQKSQTESMDKYKEWSESEESMDSTTMETDSIDQDSIM